MRNDGDVMQLRRLKRRLRQRRILLLIDVSGSMKERTETHLRIAHALAHAVERIEVFTFGTRLTRVTRAMRLQATASRRWPRPPAIVSDWDGGTRIGDALQAFLAVPRFAGYSRGALVLILSDGLERGDPAAMREAVTRLSRLAWRVSWLTPLAADPDFTPQTEALKAILPLVDDLADGSSVGAVCAACAEPGRQTRRMTDIVDAHHHIWRQADMPWLVRPDAAAHLRPLRGDPARLPDRRIPRRPRRHRRGEVGLRAGELAEGPVRGRGRLGERGRGRAAAGRTASSAMPT